MPNAEYGKLLQRKWQERMEDDHMIECPECFYNYDRFHHDFCPGCEYTDWPPEEHNDQP